jgi:excisionase family DNA binding protein
LEEGFAGLATGKADLCGVLRDQERKQPQASQKVFVLATSIGWYNCYCWTLTKGGNMLAIEAPAKPKDFLTVQECADLFRVNRQTIKNWIVWGRIPKPIRIGRNLLFSRQKIESFVTELEAKNRKK